MKNNDKLRPFVLLAKFKRRNNSDEEKFAKLLQNSSYKQELEGLHRRNSLRHKQREILNVLFQILQIQEVGSTEEYSVNGEAFQVHVLEDTEL
ncbi:hypothetical protein P5673_019170 [Acropora cervicornis]|uniref:Uncharacterized protein n=1 Tax=Acropora cervicornis TaxID=6130 RepID=A0AAD9QBX3_ACRCE|nr:hypothetical protein P5673_019170 [Acropora cervicornis]